MEQFAGYGFNKSHSAAYALLAYHTAWLKTHYPVEFMAALLTSETSKPENVVKYISECREMNIPGGAAECAVLGCELYAGEDGRRARRSALGWRRSRTSDTTRSSRSLQRARRCARKGKRGFASLWEFCEKVDLRLLNKRVLESLIKAGAMDAFGPRGQVFAALDKAMERAQKSQKDAGGGAAWPLRRHLRRGRRRPRARRVRRCRLRRTGTNTRGCRTRKKCSASSSPDIRWTNIARSCGI